MSDLVTALRLILSGSPEGAIAAIDQVASASDALGKKTDELAAKNAAAAKAGHQGMLLMAAGAGLVVAAIGACVVAAGKQEEAVIQVQKMTGLSATGASQLTEQMQALGISADSVAPILGRALKNTQGFADGATKSTSALGKAFTSLGISVDDLKGKNTDQVLSLIRDQIDKMPAGMQRTADIMAIFGRSAMTNQGLLRYLTASNSELDTINAKAKQFGLIFTQQQLDQAAKFGAMLRIVEQEFKGLAVQVGTAVIPALTTILKIAEGMLTAFQFLTRLMGPFKGLFMVFVTALPGVLLFALGLAKVVKAVDTLRESTTLMNAVQAIFRGRMGQSTVATGVNTAAKEANVKATATEDEALGANDAALATNDEALATNTADLEANDAARAGGGLAGASEDLGTVAVGGEGAAGAAGAGGLGAAGTASAIAAPIVAGILAGMIVQSHATQRTQGQTKYLQTHGGSFKKVVPHLAGGGFVKGSPEGTLIVAGDENQDEIVAPAGAQGTVTAGARGGGRSAAGGVTVQLTVQNVYGAIDRRTAELWAEPLLQALGTELWATMKGAGH